MKKTITGIYSQSKTGNFGFVDVEAIDKGYYVFPFNKKDALDGDEVSAEVKMFKGKEEAVIMKVLKRTEKVLIGEFEMGKSLKFGFVKLKDEAFTKDVFIPGKYIKKAKSGDIVGVNIIKWEGKNPEGKIMQVLGKKGDKGLEINGFILEAGFEQDFPIEVIKELNNVRANLVFAQDKQQSSPQDKQQSSYAKDKQSPSKKKRKDLRKLFTFTIDGEDAKDLDDAISIELLKSGDYKLYVHIADVAEYIKEGTNLDKNALKRATSVYLSDRVIPMLPKKLSNDLCSLNPNTDKLTLTCEMLISKFGELKETKVYESIINSDVRLSYKEVDEIVEGKSPIPNPLPQGIPLLSKAQFTLTPKGEGTGKRGILIQIINVAEDLKKSISKNKEIAGVLNFDFPETKVVLDNNKKVLEIKQYPRYKSNKMIEEFMIMANYAVSKKFSTYPFLYRIHEDPKGEDIEKLQKVLDLFNIKYKLKKISTKEFANLLKILDSPSSGGEVARGGGNKKPILEKIILRTLSKAIYSPENLGHFGLGINFYSHFTSPIRRYPDLQIHRIIKEQINGKLDKNRIIHYKNILNNIASRCSDLEKKAEKLEYKVRDYFIVQYYEDKVGEIFNGTINTIMKKGFFVSLPDTSEGFVEIQNGESFEDLQEYKDLSTGTKYTLGEQVKVKLIEADLEKIRLNFALV